LLILSALLLSPLSAHSANRVFFASGDVAFAEPDVGPRAASVGDAVVARRAGRITGRGWVFRVRPEHMTLKITEGDVRAGDLVEPLAGSDPGAIALSDMATASSRTILVARIRSAPSIVSAQFDTGFVAALLREEADPAASGSDRSAGGIRVVTWRSLGPRPPSAAEIRSAARRRSASLVILPFYRPGRDGDSIEVRVHSAETGDLVGTSVTRVLPFSDLHYLPVGRCIGRLEYHARFDGLLPPPRSVAFDTEGRLVVGSGGDAFILEESRARLQELDRVPLAVRRATWDQGDRKWTAAVENGGGRERHGRERAGEMIVIREDGEIVYRSGAYDRVTALAARDGVLAVLSGSTIELLRLE
jgi:hypothetical protein